MVKHRTAIVIDETQFALLVAGAAVCVMTPFADVEIRLSSTKPCVWHQGTGGRPVPRPAAGPRVSAAAPPAAPRLSKVGPQR